MGTIEERPGDERRALPRRLTIVVPVRDEAATIDELVRRIDASVAPLDPAFDLIVVDDASRPDQVDAMRRAAAGALPFRLIELAAPAGQVAALVCGLAAAGGDVVVTMDGDLQDPPEEIGRLVAAIGPAAAIVAGHRRNAHTDPFRRAGSAAMTHLAGLLVGVRLADYGGQFNAYDRSTVDRLIAAWRPPTALLPLACRQGAPVTEVEVAHAPRATGRSRYRPRQLAAIAVDLVLDFAPRPVLLMGAVGASVATASLLSQASWARGTFRPPMAAAAALGLGFAGRAAVRSAGRRAPAYVVRADSGPVGRAEPGARR